MKSEKILRIVLTNNITICYYEHTTTEGGQQDMVYEKIDSEKIGNRLRDIRTERGETTEKVAKGVGISTSAITMYETGQRIPRDEIKIRLAEYYGLPVERIFFATA